ncbi:MAG: hypothetical protein ACLP2P_06825 [Desulfobaccales bacterium]
MKITVAWLMVASGREEAMAKESVEKRYERHGRIKPCVLTRDDILALEKIVQGTFTKPEVERYFRISTVLNHTRVFSNSVEQLLSLGELGDRVADLSFWIEGWDQKTRFDKNILLDFSKYSIQLSVEGTDPVWVYDTYTSIINYLKNKTAWYSFIISIEKIIVFFITIILIANIIISARQGYPLYFLDKLGLLVVWMFLVFYDIRKIWPYSNIRLKEDKYYLCKENVVMLVMVLVVIFAIYGGTILPLMR